MAEYPLLDTERFHRCLEIQRRVGSEKNLQKLAQVVMSEVTALLGADRSTLYLFDLDTMELRANFAEGITGKALVLPLRMGIVGTSILRRELMNMTNAYASPYFNGEVDAALGYHTDSLLVTPMIDAQGRVLGAVELLNKASGRFTEEDEQRLQQMAARVTRWIEQGQVYPAGVEAEVAALRNAVHCDRGTVFVIEERTCRLVAMHADGDGRPISLSMKLGIAGQAAVTGESIKIDEARLDPRFDNSVDQRTGYRTQSMLCVPLKGGDNQPLGVVQAINKHGGLFGDDDLVLLQAVASIVSIAVENAMLFAEQERQFLSTLDALSACSDARDALTAGRSASVTEYALMIARELGFAEEELDQLRVAAMLHDCGMIGVDDAVLHKPATLDQAEYLHVKRHVAVAGNILKRIRFSRKFAKVRWIVAAHHEYLDGSGYPRGISGGEIPFMAKILTVADVFEALTSDRYYRKKMSRANALEVLDAGADVRFDAGAVAALHRCLERSSTTTASSRVR
ncbi:MAG TPA: HD domain-containing phosphohydrolase [Rhodocyclaceae bacterium]|nr:HD domain-containing phosphohydrolase [Rhodocyclaceae bacterium]